MAKNRKKLIFEYWLAPSWCFFGLKLINRIFWWFFRKHGHFRGWRGGGIFFCFFQILLFQKLLLRFNNKKICIYHLSNDFLQFSKGWSKNTKKAQFSNFGRLPVCQFSSDFKKISDLGYFYLYLQHILGRTKSGM